MQVDALVPYMVFMMKPLVWISVAGLSLIPILSSVLPKFLTPEVGRNVSELFRQVQAFQHVVATGEVTPSGWRPGKKTLKPSPDLAGKVWEVWKPEEAFE